MIQPIKDETKIILESIADGVFTVDADHQIKSFNRAAEEIKGKGTRIEIRQSAD